MSWREGKPVTLLAASLLAWRVANSLPPASPLPASQPACLWLALPPALALSVTALHILPSPSHETRPTRLDSRPYPSLSLPPSLPPAIFSLSTSPIRILVAVGNDQATQVRGSVSGPCKMSLAASIPKGAPRFLCRREGYAATPPP